MRKLLLLVSILALPLCGYAQEKKEQSLEFSLLGEYKAIFYPDGFAPSFGYTACFDYVNRHFIVGIGFDNGVRNASMTQYNTFFFLKGGYVFEVGRLQFIPFVRTGWFMDVRSVGNKRDIYGFHQLLASGGLCFVYSFTDWVFLTVSAGGVMTNLSGKGLSVNAGFTFPLHYFPCDTK